MSENQGKPRRMLDADARYIGRDGKEYTCCPQTRRHVRAIVHAGLQLFRAFELRGDDKNPLCSVAGCRRSVRADEDRTPRIVVREGNKYELREVCGPCSHAITAVRLEFGDADLEGYEKQLEEAHGDVRRLSGLLMGVRSLRTSDRGRAEERANKLQERLDAAVAARRARAEAEAEDAEGGGSEPDPDLTGGDDEVADAAAGSGARPGEVAEGGDEEP